MKNFNIIPFGIVALLLMLVYFMNKEHKEQLTTFCKIAYQEGVKDGLRYQSLDNIKKGVMNKDGKWKDGFKLAR